MGAVQGHGLAEISRAQRARELAAQEAPDLGCLAPELVGEQGPASGGGGGGGDSGDGVASPQGATRRRESPMGDLSSPGSTAGRSPAAGRGRGRGAARGRGRGRGGATAAASRSRKKKKRSSSSSEEDEESEESE